MFNDIFIFCLSVGGLKEVTESGSGGMGSKKGLREKRGGVAELSHHLYVCKSHNK